MPGSPVGARALFHPLATFEMQSRGDAALLDKEIAMSVKRNLIVTRHPGAVEWLQPGGIEVSACNKCVWYFTAHIALEEV